MKSITKEEILKIYRPINPKAHKGTQGHALLIGGSYGKMGSVVLSSKAALRSGCGLVTAFVPKQGLEIVQAALPEAMALADENKKYITNIDFEIEPDAIGIGMGMGQEEATQKGFHKFLQKNEKPLLVDADGLNMLSNNKSWISLLRPKTILTPHYKELQRLLGEWNSEEEKLEMAKEFSIKHELILVVKGAPTVIIDGKNTYENTTGNAALATAGSGDTLSGIITSFLAQGYVAHEASILGVYLHGLTADLALPRTGYQSFIASDIVAHLGEAFLYLDRK